MSPRDDRRLLPGLTGAAALGAAVTYSLFLIAPLCGSHLPVGDSFPSELEAVGQPHAGWFRLADAVSGILIVLAVLGAYRLSTFGSERLGAFSTAVLGLSSIAITGLASVSDAATTMGCAPSSSAACRAEDASVTGLLGQVFEAHTVSGLVGFAGASVGMILLGLALRPRSRGWGTASVALGFVLAGIGLVDLALLLVSGPFGFAERARDVAVSLWLAGLSALLLLAPAYPRAAAGSSAGSPAGHRIGSGPS